MVVNKNQTLFLGKIIFVAPVVPTEEPIFAENQCFFNANHQTITRYGHTREGKGTGCHALRSTSVVLCDPHERAGLLASVCVWRHIEFEYGIGKNRIIFFGQVSVRQAQLET